MYSRSRFDFRFENREANLVRKACGRCVCEYDRVRVSDSNRDRSFLMTEIRETETIVWRMASSRPRTRGLRLAVERMQLLAVAGERSRAPTWTDPPADNMPNEPSDDNTPNETSDDTTVYSPTFGMGADAVVQDDQVQPAWRCRLCLLVYSTKEDFVSVAHLLMHAYGRTDRNYSARMAMELWGSGDDYESTEKENTPPN